MNILIVDDNHEMRRMVKSLIGDLAEELYECKDGREALAAYAEHLPEWVLMDIKMDGLDGLIATRQIKEAHPEAQVMILTNDDDADLRAAAREAGACAYVSKEDLLEVRRILGERT